MTNKIHSRLSKQRIKYLLSVFTVLLFCSLMFDNLFGFCKGFIINAFCFWLFYISPKSSLMDYYFICLKKGVILCICAFITGELLCLILMSDFYFELTASILKGFIIFTGLTPVVFYMKPQSKNACCALFTTYIMLASYCSQ